MLKLKGDTLIEVTIAVGIFSMVAVAVVSVINGSASGAQVALEATLTREEIDAQAEALRFIHSSYISSGHSGDTDPASNPYANIWQKIINNATESEYALNYSPSTCDDLYDGNRDDGISKQSAFVIDTKNLNSKNANDVVIDINTYSKKFTPASTYPRLIYGDGDTETPLYEGTTDINSDVSRVEGIYIVAVKDNNTTTVVTNNSTIDDRASAYYNFYIRTCWYGPGADRPSTISTVIRLYNPDINK